MSRILWFLIRWSLRLLPLALLAGVLNFYLPGHDVVRIVGTEVNRVDRAPSGAKTREAAPGLVTRDVRFINAVRQDLSPAVYRNEDTRWGFPWYFKFNSGNLQATAQDLISTRATPQWVVITHYGWRIELLSKFPNAVDIEQIDGPDVTIIPWFNIIFLIVLAVVLLLIWRAWRRLLEKLAVDDRFENASNSGTQLWRWSKATVRDRRDKWQTRNR